MVQLEEVTDLMNEMMKVEIFRPSEKHRMLKDYQKALLDPNLIMDARHRIFREDLSVSPTKSSVLAEARRLLTEEETRELYFKKEQKYLQKELKKFERELQKSRPKFSGPYGCSRRSVAHSDDEEFWRTSRRAKEKTIIEKISQKNYRNCQINFDPIRKTEKKSLTDDDNCSTLTVENNNKEDSEFDSQYIGSIKVTIKDKSNSQSDEERISILTKCFDALKRYVEEERRFREIKTKIQQNTSTKLTTKYFGLWRTYLKNARSVVAQKQKEEQDVSDERKIEMFINAITERQKELMKGRKTADANAIAGNTSNVEIKKKNIYCKHVIVESPAQSRLNAQKRIIEEQRAKLAEQNRIIEELKLKQTQQEITKANKETVNAAKAALAHCGQRTKRTLIQLMRQTGYRNKSLTVSQRPPSPPEFLSRMEARAEARRERIKLAEETRRKKLEEQKRKEETARIEEDQEKRRLQQEALREAKRLREEQERKRLREMEKLKKLNRTADDFYRKYLLRRYILQPLMIFVESRNNDIRKADDRYRQTLTRKVFAAWKTETANRCRINTEIAVFSYNRKLLLNAFAVWKEATREENLKCQVSKDFHDMKVFDKFFKFWQIRIRDVKIEREKNERLAQGHYQSKLRSRYFNAWKKYPQIATDIKESERRRNELRQIVQKVIPDFDPKQRGVAIED